MNQFIPIHPFCEHKDHVTLSHVGNPDRYLQCVNYFRGLPGRW